MKIDYFKKVLENDEKNKEKSLNFWFTGSGVDLNELPSMISASQVKLHFYRVQLTAIKEVKLKKEERQL